MAFRDASTLFLTLASFNSSRYVDRFDRIIPGVHRNRQPVMNMFGYATTEPNGIGTNTCGTNKIQLVFIPKSQTRNKENS
jgi:hypothetical protein